MTKMNSYNKNSNKSSKAYQACFSTTKNSSNNVIINAKGIKILMSFLLLLVIIILKA